MLSEKVIRPEKLLLAYLNFLLINGYTDGITEEEFFKFVDEMNYEFLKEENKCEVQRDGIYKVVEDANYLNRCNSKSGIYIEIVDGKLTILPTYDLKSDMEHEYLLSLGFSYNQIGILNKLFSKKLKKVSCEFFDFRNLSEEKRNLAKKVGAFIVNDLLQRYIKFEVSRSRWPIQCLDIDKYIFKKNIAQYIDLECTLAKCEELYAQAVRVVYTLLNNHNNSSKILFSTNRVNCLAYANYKKILAPKEFSFLEEFEEYAVKEKEFLNIRIENGIAMFSEEKYMYAYDGYHLIDVKEQIISEHEVSIMDSRIASVI